MHSRFIATAIFVVLASATAASATSPGQSPYFPDGPYEITVDVSPPGLESFIINGIVRDDDPGDSIIFMTATAGSFISFDYTPGNPATFTYQGGGFTYNDIGSRFVLGIGALDKSFNGGGTTVTVHVVPEPTTAGLLAASLMCGTRRKRSRC